MVKRTLTTPVSIWKKSCLALAALTIGVAVAGCSRKAPPPVASGRPDSKALQLYASGAKAYDAGDKQKGMADLEAAVAADPNLIMARTRLGDAYNDADEYGKAAEQYEALTRLDPSEPASWYKLGM